MSGRRKRRVEGLTERIRQLVYESGKPNYAIGMEISGHNEKTGHTIVNRWVNNDAQPEAYYLTAICKYFDVSADWLLGLSDRRERR